MTQMMASTVDNPQISVAMSIGNGTRIQCRYHIVIAAVN